MAVREEKVGPRQCPSSVRSDRGTQASSGESIPIRVTADLACRILMFSPKPRLQLIDVRLRQPAFLRCRDNLLHVARPGLARGAVGCNVDEGPHLPAARNVDSHESLSVYALHDALVPVEGTLVF